MRDEQFRDLLVRHAVSELPADERSELEEELERRGEDGRRELRRVREAFAHVSLSAPPEAPPEGLRDEVLAAAAETPQEGGGGPPSESASHAEKAPETIPVGRRWMAAAAVIGAVGVGLFYWNLQLQSDLDRAENRLEAMTTRLARADSARRAMSALQNDLATVASPSATVRTLAGTEEEPGARARVFVDPVTGRALLFAYDLPVLPPDTIYQLWAIEDEEPRSLGTFTASGRGPARVELETLDPVQSADALAVTVEPAPGQPAPTGKMVLQGSL